MATPIAIAVMSVVALLAAGAALAALGSSEGANEDRRSKGALAAAEAGIQKAAYQLATLRPLQTMCLGVNGAAADPVAGGECAPVNDTSIAPGASVSYVATPALPAGAACADVPNIAADATSTDHCITSTGVVGTVRRRLQARVRVARGGLFSGIGLVGLDSVNMVNSHKVWSDVGSNGLIDGDNSIEIMSPARLRVPTTAPTPTISGSNPPVVRLSSPWALAQTDFASVAASNNNSALASLPSSRWNPTTKVLNFSSSGSLTLPGGNYHMCDFYANNSVTVTLQASATPSNPVRLFIDSPTRPGSGCTGTTGRFCLNNSVNVNASGNAAALEIYVYGTTATCGQIAGFDGSSYEKNAPIVLNNSINLRGTIYAPTASVRLNNSIKMDGGIAARTIHFENSVEFRHPSSLTGSPATAGPIRRLSWVECRPQPTTATDHESGCT